MQRHSRGLPSSLPYCCSFQSPIETWRPATRAGNGGLRLLHTQGSMFKRMCLVTKIPHTKYGSRPRTDSTPCRPLLLVVPILPLHSEPQQLLLRSCRSPRSRWKWWLQQSPHQLVCDQDSADIPEWTFILQAVLLPPLRAFNSMHHQFRHH